MNNLADGDVLEAVREYMDHAHVASLLNHETVAVRNEVTMELGLLVRSAVGIYEEVNEATPDADAIAAERSDIRHDRKVDDKLTEVA